MKKSDFIKKVLKSRRNTVFVNKEQVENSLMIFEDLGMLAPNYHKEIDSGRVFNNIMDIEEGIGFNTFFGWESEDER